MLYAYVLWNILGLLLQNRHLMLSVVPVDTGCDYGLPSMTLREVLVAKNDPLHNYDLHFQRPTSLIDECSWHSTDVVTGRSVLSGKVFNLLYLPSHPRTMVSSSTHGRWMMIDGDTYCYPVRILFLGWRPSHWLFWFELAWNFKIERNSL